MQRFVVRANDFVSNRTAQSLDSSARAMSLFSRPFAALAQALSAAPAQAGTKVSRHQDRKGILVFTLRISVSLSLPLPMPACQNATPETCKRANGSSPHLKAFPCGRANVIQVAVSGAWEDTRLENVLDCKARLQSRALDLL